MAKDPAFLFYPNDWIGGTMGMTFEEKGAYMELLMMQFNRGHMTKHMMGQVVGQMLDKLLDKFVQDAKGLYYNERLEQEQIKRKSFVISRLNNKKGINGHTKKVGHMTSHMENENINENVIKDSFGKRENLFKDLTENEINNSIEYLDRTAQKKFTSEQVLNFWEGFKIQYGNDYKQDRGEVIKHFRNWLKKQENGKQLNQTGNKSNYGQSAGAISLIERVKEQINQR